MRYLNQGRFRQQVSFLQQQFLQDGSLPFSDLLSTELITQALTALQVGLVDCVYTPLVTLCVFLGQVLSADHSCRAAVARLRAYRVARKERACSPETSAYRFGVSGCISEIGIQLVEGSLKRPHRTVC